MLKYLALFLLFFALSIPVYSFDPSLPNNKFGIHLAVPDEQDLKDAGKLVNSSGGKWGYVTLVIQENDRDPKKWQEVFDTLRELRLIPIIRLATQPVGDTWRRPKKEDAREWVSFLNSLNWVVKDRYVVLFNEPNHGAEWGGAVDPKDYGEVAFSFAKALKEKNKNFFVMLAGFDSAAPSQPPLFEDEEVFLRKITEAQSSLSDLLDGWASHSYPNPGFAGSPQDFGRGTVRGYQWERDLLKNLGINRDFPIFITETGWKHGELSPETVGEYIAIAYQTVWLPDQSIRAVTPFVLNYQGEPFLSFSWKRPQSDEYFTHYDMIQALEKEKGAPEQEERGRIEQTLPKKLVAESSYRFKITLHNEGQAIWDREDGYYLKIEEPYESYFFSDLKSISPNQEAEIDLFIKTQGLKGKESLNIALYKDDKKVLSSVSWTFTVVPLPRLSFKVRLFPKLKPDDSRRYELQIFDKREQLVLKKSNVKIKGGVGALNAVQNVYLGEDFRVVILTQNYLPRQGFITFKEGENAIVFERMLPLDFDRDGNFDLADIGALLKNPRLFALFLP
ncbi:hypothetical protein HYT33_01140 [Candidatus Roizmanbacteria bacterium]|nr:hypothetical protein [Candidatus Roizmanbacteria bacterium]